MRRSIHLAAAVVVAVIVACGGPPSTRLDRLYRGLDEALPRVDPMILDGRRILVDPGHGGFYRGTMGRDSLEESSVNLGVSLYLWGLLTEADGIPVGLAVAGANVNDFKLARETIESIPVKRPRPSRHKPQNLCLDKGYDYDEVRDLAVEFGFTAHIRSRGEEAKLIRRSSRFKARRWVVERTHSWMNRYRRILIRWEKKPENYTGMLHL
ncbi:MAG: IS5 family transposase, partial [Candidatus Krumholzibacteriota bacterium]|nr:IS5 family transposase [Candidatus Krumholzibacteriota bacterium]